MLSLTKFVNITCTACYSLLKKYVIMWWYWAFKYLQPPCRLSSRPVSCCFVLVRCWYYSCCVLDECIVACDPSIMWWLYGVGPVCSLAVLSFVPFCSCSVGRRGVPTACVTSQSYCSISWSISMFVDAREIFFFNFESIQIDYKLLPVLKVLLCVMFVNSLEALVYICFGGTMYSVMDSRSVRWFQL